MTKLRGYGLSIFTSRPVSGTSSDSPGKIRAREITERDFAAVAELLGKGIGYSSSYFLLLLRRMAHRPIPIGFPKYGRLLECDGKIVGAIILIFSTIWSDRTATVRCHVTGWCVEPPFRCYAALFFSKDLKHSGVTYLNISAQPATFPIIEAQGFTQYANGQFLAVPILQFASGDGDAKVVDIHDLPTALCDSHERDLLLTHANYGCICFWCVTAQGAYPFAFRPRFFKRILPGVQLVYCRDIKDFARFAGPIGRFLASRGRLVTRIDANGPIQGLIGMFLNGVDSRYYKGPKPRLGDLAYTHLAMCEYVRRRKTRA